MDANVICDYKLDPCEPRALVGNAGQMKRLAGITNDEHDFRLGPRNRSPIHLLDLVGQAAVIHMAFASLRTADGHVSAGRKNPRGIASSDDAGNSELAGHNGGMSRSSALIRYNGGNPPHHGLPIRISILRYQYFSGFDLLQLAHIAHNVSAAGTNLFSNRLASDQ